MQLVPPLMALRDAVGIERVVVDTYQSVAGTGHKAIVELEEQVKAHAEGRAEGRERLPAPDRVQRPARTSTCSSTTGTRRRSGRSSPRAARSSTCRSSGSAARPSASRCSSATPRRSTSRRARRSRPTRPATLFAGVKGVVVQDDPAEQRLPARDRGHGIGRRVRRPGAPGPVDRRQPRPRLLGRVATTCARARRRTPSRSPRRSSSAAGSARRPRAPARSGRRGAGPRDARRAPGGARGHRRRGPGLHAVPPATRRGRRPSRARATRTPRSSSSARARASTRTARAGRSSVAPAACSCGSWRRSAGSARTCSSPTSSSAARPTTATRSRTRSRPARRTCGASSRCSTRRSSSPSVATRWARSCPGARIGQAHGTSQPVDPETGAANALVFAMYHPAAALRTPARRARQLRRHRAASPSVLVRGPRAPRPGGASPRPRPGDHDSRAGTRSRT